MKLFKIVLAATGLLSAAFVQSEANADDKFYLAPEVAYVLPTDGDVDDGVFVGAKFGYKLDDSYAVELESGWSELAWDPDNVGVDNIDIEVVPVLLNLRYSERCSEDEIGWYGFLGAGWSFNNMTSNVVGAEADDSFAWQAGLGLDIPVNTDLDAFVDVRYLWNRADLEAPDLVETSISDDIVLSSVLFSAGLKF